MSVSRTLLLERLDAIGRSVAERDGLALLGLGSCADTSRLDEHSDLDFFVIVRPGRGPAWRDDLAWLSACRPIASAHRNTEHGWKVLYEDGVFCEFAVFEPQELATIPFAPGRLVWASEGFDQALAIPGQTAGPIDRLWEGREALANLLIGLKRLHRGEKLSAWRSICVDGSWHGIRACCAGPPGDPFVPDRRLEQTDPDLAARLSVCLTLPDGLDRAGLTRSALVLADLLFAHGASDPGLDRAVRELAGHVGQNVG